MTVVKAILAIAITLFSALAFAATDVNKATQAELESIKGIGPSMSARIVEARTSGAFKDWTDLQSREKGVGAGNAAKFSAEGLTVNGAALTATTVTAAAATKKK
jgi:competence protein ComEA